MKSSQGKKLFSLATVERSLKDLLLQIFNLNDVFTPLKALHVFSVQNQVAQHDLYRYAKYPKSRNKCVPNLLRQQRRRLKYVMKLMQVLCLTFIE